MAMGEAASPVEALEPHYEHFRVHYQHVMFDSYWPLEGGTLRAVQIEHPMAVVEADESSRVRLEAGL